MQIKSGSKKPYRRRRVTVAAPRRPLVTEHSGGDAQTILAAIQRAHRVNLYRRVHWVTVYGERGVMERWTGLAANTINQLGVSLAAAGWRLAITSGCLEVWTVLHG